MVQEEVRISKAKVVMPTERRGPTKPAPDYSEYDANVMNQFFMKRFQRALEKELKVPASEVSFEEIVGLAKAIHKRNLNDPHMVRLIVEKVFHDIFGSMLPTMFRGMFSGPMPNVSARMAAFVTSLGSQWLMGPNKLEEQLVVHIERCRFLEEAGCVNVCVNGCKKPTESFIKNALGVDLYIEPNYDDFSCKFKFGEKPPPTKEDPAFAEPCFLQCPTASRLMKSRGAQFGSKCDNTPLN
eukprot:Plantae.Rhodophyta-Purpureofilum_apyrenoidigerum.ctg5816.p1 GENE.Plantae.Rhodophyta-Purpureofilum_apyrenoidigerum.ctg5816~~Plantae.Rhodophyta-Purpureofilum_apyrenoidigerum.ctg5816.p1  ORF type:complete len:248 (+),score=47.99 Plantae.Rhodophyta-Purpureofilum_apyrenoidigerum.ctg5816:26-745(+)